MKKWLAIPVVLILLVLAVALNYDRTALLIPTDFSDTEMVFESDGSTRYYYDTLSDDGKQTPAQKRRNHANDKG